MAELNLSENPGTSRSRFSKEVWRFSYSLRISLCAFPYRTRFLIYAICVSNTCFITGRRTSEWAFLQKPACDDLENALVGSVGWWNLTSEEGVSSRFGAFACFVPNKWEILLLMFKRFRVKIDFLEWRSSLSSLWIIEGKQLSSSSSGCFGYLFWMQSYHFANCIYI